MELSPSEVYHVYNEGNSDEKIFISNKDHLDFLKKARYVISPYCEILAYCLMPNHFHFLLQATEKSSEIFLSGNIYTNRLSNASRLTLS